MLYDIDLELCNGQTHFCGLVMTEINNATYFEVKTYVSNNDV